MCPCCWWLHALCCCSCLVLRAVVVTWVSAWIGFFAAWKCTMNQLNDRRLMMMSKRVLFLRIYWIVIRHSVPRWITVLGFSPANCDTSAFCGIDDWGLVKCRFSATQSSKRGRKRLANGILSGVVAHQVSSKFHFFLSLFFTIVFAIDSLLFPSWLSLGLQEKYRCRLHCNILSELR